MQELCFIYAHPDACKHFTVNNKPMWLYASYSWQGNQLYAYFKYHIGSASLVTFSLAFMIFFIWKKKKELNWTISFFLTTNSQSLPTKKTYLHIDKIVEWVYVLLHKSFHLENTCMQQIASALITLIV